MTELTAGLKLSSLLGRSAIRMGFLGNVDSCQRAFDRSKTKWLVTNEHLGKGRQVGKLSLVGASLVMFAALLMGCGTTDDPKNYEPSSSSSDTGEVCLYRTAPRSTSGAWQDWVLDGKWTGEIRPDRYYCQRIHVGRHIVRVSVSDEAVEFSINKDEQVYIRFEVDGSQKGKSFSIYPVLVDREIAHEELRAKGRNIDRSSTSP